MRHHDLSCIFFVPISLGGLAVLFFCIHPLISLALLVLAGVVLLVSSVVKELGGFWSIALVALLVWLVCRWHDGSLTGLNTAPPVAQSTTSDLADTTPAPAVSADPELSGGVDRPDVLPAPELTTTSIYHTEGSAIESSPERRGHDVQEPSGVVSARDAHAELTPARLVQGIQLDRRCVRYYPEAARRRGEEGLVVLDYTLDSKGYVSTASVQGSSGIPSLDAAALRCLREQARFVPDDLAGRDSAQHRLRYRWRLTDY